MTIFVLIKMQIPHLINFFMKKREGKKGREKRKMKRKL